MKPKQRVETLRERMRHHGVTAYFIPTTDAHMSEYVPSCWQRRAWISGFTGSAGEVLILLDGAGLWTDGRYFLQAESELRGSGIKLFKSGRTGVPTLEEYLVGHLGRNGVLGVDPRVVSLHRMRKLEAAVAQAGATVRKIEPNLIDEVWHDRPPMPAAPVRILKKQFSGETTSSKLRRVRKAMEKRKADAHVLTALDAVAWLFNIRGQDVEFNPVAIAYALVTPDRAMLFTEESRLPETVRTALSKSVEIRPYAAIEGAVRDLAKSGARVWVERATVNQWIVDLLEDADLITELSPVTDMKSIKNPVEVEGMRQAHVRDGVAVSRFLCWLEAAVDSGEQTEISAADKLESLRAEGEHFQGLSFRTISGYADHGAIIHYSVSPETDVPLRREGIYLVDSGGQYLDGTTDITRTVLLGKKATGEQKDRFTRVLKGHIALAKARFPEGTPGVALDALARQPLWESSLDYNHGTGHGVGHFLNVHEGPRSIANRSSGYLPLEPGNILSNEPGYYKDGEYGIRIENLVLVSQNGGTGENGKSYYAFETLTVCPIDTRLVDVRMLEESERKWLNQYHRHVLRTLSPHLDSREKAWLKKACAAV